MHLAYLHYLCGDDTALNHDIDLLEFDWIEIGFFFGVV